VVASLALTALTVALPAVLGRGADAVIGDAPTWWLTVSAIAVALLVVCDALEDLAAGGATARSTAWLRHTLVHHILAMGARAGDRFSPGDVASRLSGNAADAGRVAPDAIRTITNLLPPLGGIVALGLIDPWLCVTFLAGLPLLGALVRMFAREATDVAERYLTVQASIAGRLMDALSGVRTIAASGTVDREVRRVLEPLPALHRHGMGMWRAQIRISAQDAVLVALLEVAVLAVAGAELANGRITPGELFAASQYVVLGTTIGNVATSLARLARDRAGAGRAAELLAAPIMTHGSASLPPGDGHVELRGVTAVAGGRTVLDGIDLDLPPKALIAIVGPSGAGKSLLAAVIGRLVDPDEGDVLLDGTPLAALDRDALRTAVTFSHERPNLVGPTVSETDTLSDVIAFGAHTPPGDDIVSAARSAQADVFIRRLPDGYRTRHADAPMSGGEAQRLGVARAFAHAGRVLIFDDVAASLDTVTEHEISEVLTNELQDRTRVVIAHRASTAARADLVVWLDHGRVREVASHRDLWRDRDYRSLFGSSAGDERGSDAPGARVAEVVA
jgi:ATP-binding cassette subfamily B protein